MLSKRISTIWRVRVAVVVLASCCLPAMAGPASVDQYGRFVAYLSSPQMEGRGPGTAGLDEACKFIARQFLTADLTPAFGAARIGHGRAFAQQFEMSLGVKVEQQSLQFRVGDMTFEDMGAATEHYNALGFSASGTFRGDVAFVGYGIVEPDFDYDSYEGMAEDVLRDKVFVAFRYEPRGKDGRSRWSGKKGRGGPWTQAADLTKKARWAQERGAAALIIVNPPSHETGSLKSTARSVFSPAAQIPVFHMTTESMTTLLGRLRSNPGTLLKRWQQLADQDKGHVEIIDHLNVTGSVELTFPKTKVANVAGVVRGEGELADEVIVIGAHYDHLGYGGPGAFVKGRQIHPGADDNASGTAGLLMLARRFAQRATAGGGATDRRSILFAAFTAEERGLLGSAHLVKHLDDLGIRPDQIVAMINMDMIGRMQGKKLIVMGAGTGDRWKSMLKASARRVGLKLKMREAGIGPSDHASFYHLKVPVLHFFTGTHEDYHRPSDTADKINVAGAVKVLDLIETLTEELWAGQQRVTFVAAKPDPHSGVVAGPGLGRAYLGVMPDYATMDSANGCGLAGISPGSPAEKAGLTRHDVLVRWNERKIGNVYDLTAALQDHEPNDQVTLIVQRGEQELEIVVELGERG